MKMNQARVALLASLLFFTLPIHAEPIERGPYLGIDLGFSRIDDFCSDVESLLPAGVSGTCAETDFSWGLFGGYSFLRNFGIEGGYSNLGDAAVTLTGQNPATGATRSADISLDASTFYLAGVGRWFFSDQGNNVFAKIGGHRWDVETSAAGISVDDSGTGLMVSLGAESMIADRFGLAASVQRFRLDSTNIYQFSLSGRYLFSF